MKHIENFELPEYWYVTVTSDNIEILGKWRFEADIFPLDFKPGSVVGYLKEWTRKQWDRNQTSGNWVNEITFEQFKEHILGEFNPISIPKTKDDVKYLILIIKELNKQWKKNYQEIGV